MSGDAPPYRLHLAEDGPAVARAAADAIVAAINESIAARGRCSVALAGGSTPKATYRLLVEAPIDWTAVDVYFGDERCVPADDPDSNFAMATDALLSHVPIPPEHIHRLEADRDDRDAAALEYSKALPDPVDIVILGIGEDAHTASIFPGGDAVHETARRLMPVIGPKPPPWRLTVTPSVIETARAVIVIAAGAGKADALYEATTHEPDPARWPIQLARAGLFIIDRAAAARLP